MELGWIIQTVTMLGIGAIGFFLKGFFAEVKQSNKENREAIMVAKVESDKKLEAAKVEFERKLEAERDRSDKNYKDVNKQVNDLKDGLPFIYVTREDWIRVSNATDTKITSIDSKIDKILEKLKGRGESNA